MLICSAAVCLCAPVTRRVLVCGLHTRPRLPAATTWSHRTTLYSTSQLSSRLPRLSYYIQAYRLLAFAVIFSVLFQFQNEDLSFGYGYKRFNSFHGR